MKLSFKNFWKKLTSKMEPVVFFGAAFVVIGFCLFGGFFTETAADVFDRMENTISGALGWYYNLVTTAFLVFVLWLAFGPFGQVRLGPPDSRPEFGYAGWFAMLFSAGMGTGIVFWGVAEPLSHYSAPPYAEAETPAAAREAMLYAYFHWGLHPWAIYLVLALSLAYFHFRHDLPLAPRAILYPLVGKARMNGMAGHFIDILCTVGTLLGVATSLGLGAMQINAGLTQFSQLTQEINVQIVIIACITLVATISVVSGIHAGIRRLSQLNLLLSGGLLMFVFCVGPTLYILETFVGALGFYLQNLPSISLKTNFAQQSEWQENWTFFYWGWWISWSPFVGVFIARISRGRSIREFVLWVLLLPALGTFFWMATFGGTALHMEMFGQGGLASQVQENVGISLHAMLQELPLANLSMMFATVVILIFFITSSDSGSLVDDMVTSGGHPNPAKPQRVFWAFSEGSVAAILLLVGGLRAIQDASISMGSLMSLVLILACISLTYSLMNETERKRVKFLPWIKGD